MPNSKGDPKYSKRGPKWVLTKRDNEDQVMMVTHAGGSFGRLHLELIVIGNGGSSEKSTPKLGWGLVLVLVLGNGNLAGRVHLNLPGF